MSTFFAIESTKRCAGVRVVKKFAADAFGSNRLEVG
jgi:hypothetical protein